MDRRILLAITTIAVLLVVYLLWSHGGGGACTGPACSSAPAPSGAKENFAVTADSLGKKDLQTRIGGAVNDMLASSTLAHENDDYADRLVDENVDRKTIENHTRWTKEMKGFSGTQLSMLVGSGVDHSAYDFVGFNRPSAVVTDKNNHQLTEIDENDLAGNRRIKFL